MADVTEVIHKITYEVNNDALDNATRAIQLQLQELARLSRMLENYTRQVDAAQRGSVQNMEAISKQVEMLTAKIVSEAGKTKGLLNEVFQGLVKGITGNDSLKDVVSSYVSKVAAELSKLEAAGKKTEIGFKKSTGNTATAMSSLVKGIGSVGKNFLSFTNVVGLVLTALSFLSNKLYDTKDSADDTAGAIDKVAESSKRLGEEAGNEVGKLLSLKTQIEDTSLSYNKRIEAVKKLRDLYPDYFKDMSDEELLAGKVADAYNRVLIAIVASAKARVLQKDLDEAISKVIEVDQRIKDLAKQKDVKLNVTVDKVTGLNTYSIDGEGRIPNSLNSTLIFNEMQYGYSSELEGVEDKFTELSNQISLQSAQTSTVKDILSLIGDNNKLLQSTSNKGGGRGGDNNKTEENPRPRASSEPPMLMSACCGGELPDKLNIDKKTVEVTPVEVPQARDEDEEDDEKKKKKRKKKKGEDDEGNDKKQRGLTEAQKENIKKGIDSYQQLAQAAADAYNKIIQAQINALEQEISIQEKRVEEAKKLAEKGNVDALRIEEERLRKAQQQKERYVRQQQAVNAALTVSNAIAAVAEAAVAGGGFGSIATIAALIAALAAGYAAVTSMSNDSSQAFADGVVDYKGKGGPRDDKNWVRISSGESIITAEGTQRNRALLEAINKGAALHMIDPTLPLLMPMLKQPAAITGNTYATAGDMNKLEQKLDEVVDAIADNKMKQNIFFNEHGVGIMTERAMKKDRRRWS